MRLFTNALLVGLLMSAGAMQAQPLVNRWNPTGGAGAEAASQYRGIAVNQQTGRVYISSSATPTGVVYWDRAAWDKPASPIAAPTGTFALNKPDGTAWGSASPYGITIDADGNVYLYAFSDKKIYAYASDGTFRFKVSTDGGTTDLASTQQARFLHVTGSYGAGTLAFVLVGATSPGNVYRLMQTGGPGVNQFTEAMLFAEQNDGATNYAALASADGNSVYVSSSGAGTATRGLIRYVYNGTWGVDPAWPAIRETVHDLNFTADGKSLVVSIPGSRAFRVYNAETGSNTGGVNYGVSGAAMASGGAASFGNTIGMGVGHVTATRSYFEVFDAAQPLAVAPADAPGGLSLAVRGQAVRLTSGETRGVRAEAFNLLGQRVAVLFDGTVVAGAPEVLVLGGLTPGLYIVRVSGRGVAATAPVVVVR